MTTTTPAIRAAQEIAAWTTTLGLDVDKFASQTASLWASREIPFNVTSRDVGNLEHLIKDFLGTHSFVVGAGVIFSTDAIENRDGVLEWWIKRAQAIEKLEFDLTPGGERFYDYQNMPFFTSASQTGEQSMWGPYVDYLGLDEYILTYTSPLQVGGRFAGVAGCDIRIRQLEDIFMPALRAIPGDAALLNGSNRVVVGNSGAFLVGERIRNVPGDKRLVPIEVPHLGLSLLSSR